MSTKPPPSFAGSSLAKLTVEERLNRLESHFKVTDDGVYITSDKKLVLKGVTIEIQGAATVVMKGGATVEVAGGATLMLQGGASAFLKAGIVKLNNGTQPVAFSGSRVVSMGPFGKVDQGNATVLV
jgi:hypothetical protein